MPLLQQQQTPAYHWAIWHITETEGELAGLFPHSATFDVELQRFTAPHRRAEWLAVRALLYAMLGSATSNIIYDSKGRPSLYDGNYHISISHTKGYAAIILCRDHETGIDIEQYGTRVQKVTAHFMHPDERPTLYHDDTTWSLLLHWSAKETIYKCLNHLEVDFVQHIRILPFEVHPQGTFQAKEYRTPQQEEYTIHYQLHPDFVLTYTFSNCK